MCVCVGGGGGARLRIFAIFLGVQFFILYKQSDNIEPVFIA